MAQRWISELARELNLHVLQVKIEKNQPATPVLLFVILTTTRRAASGSPCSVVTECLTFPPSFLHPILEGLLSKAEANEVALASRREVFAVSYTAARGEVAPAATTEHAARARTRARRIVGR